MPKIKLQFSSQPTITSKLIQWRDWSEYSHVDMIMPDGRLFGAMGDGVKLRDPYKTSKKIVLEVEVTQQMNDIYLRASLELGKPYDYAGIFGFIFNRNWQESDKWFCSELIAWCFKEEGINLLRTDDISRISPATLILSPLLK